MGWGGARRARRSPVPLACSWQDVPLEVQKSWFEDVVTASTELRTITMGLRCMLEYFHDCTVPLGLSDCLDAVARGARLLAGGRRARMFLVREADNGTQYLWSETRRRQPETAATGAGGAGAGAGDATSSSFKQGRRAVRLPMPTYIPDEDLIRTPGALPPMLQRVERAAAQLGQTPGFVGLAAMSRRAIRVASGSSREHPVRCIGASQWRSVPPWFTFYVCMAQAFNAALDKPVADGCPVLVCPIIMEVTTPHARPGASEPTVKGGITYRKLIGVIEVSACIVHALGVTK